MCVCVCACVCVCVCVCVRACVCVCVCMCCLNIPNVIRSDIHFSIVGVLSIFLSLLLRDGDSTKTRTPSLTHARVRHSYDSCLSHGKIN